MPFLALHVVLSFLLDLAHVFTRADHDQALEGIVKVTIAGVRCAILGA